MNSKIRTKTSLQEERGKSAKLLPFVTLSTPKVMHVRRQKKIMASRTPPFSSQSALFYALEAIAFIFINNYFVSKVIIKEGINGLQPRFHDHPGGKNRKWMQVLWNKPISFYLTGDTFISPHRKHLWTKI